MKSKSLVLGLLLASSFGLPALGAIEANCWTGKPYYWYDDDSLSVDVDCYIKTEKPMDDTYIYDAVMKALKEGTTLSETEKDANFIITESNNLYGFKKNEPHQVDLRRNGSFRVYDGVWGTPPRSSGYLTIDYDDTLSYDDAKVQRVHIQKLNMIPKTTNPIKFSFSKNKISKKLKKEIAKLRDIHKKILEDSFNQVN